MTLLRMRVAFARKLRNVSLFCGKIKQCTLTDFALSIHIGIGKAYLRVREEEGNSKQNEDIH